MRALLLLAALTAVPGVPSQPAGNETGPLWGRGYIHAGDSAARPLTLELFEGVMPTGGSALPPLSVPLLPVTADLGRPGGHLELRAGAPRLHPEARTQVPLITTVRVPGPGVYAPAPAAVTLEAPLAVNPAVPAPPSVPRAGQAFLRLDGEGEGVTYRRGDQPLAYSALNGRTLRLKRLEQGRALFDVEGVGEVVRGGPPASGFADLAPLVEDPDLAGVRARYEGKRVWGYGGLRGSCSPSPGAAVGWDGPPSSSARVRHVLRLSQPMNLNVQGGFGGDAAPGADTLALTPLVFVLDQARGVEVGGSFSIGGAIAPPSDPAALGAWLGQIAAPAGCGATYTVYLPDTWAAERVFSLTAPSSAVPSTPPDSALGLTRWQYAWLTGFPNATYGTRDTLLRAGQWQYRNIPFPATVTFGPGGRVTAVEVPSLP